MVWNCLILVSMVNGKSLLNNNWVVGIGGSIAATLILSIVDLIFKMHIISNALKWLVNFSVNKYSLPLWMLLLIFCSGLVTMFLIIKITLKNIYRAEINTEDDIPLWLGYTEDVFDGILYKWEYSKRNNTSYTVVRIIPYCKKDNCMLDENDYCIICEKYFEREDEYRIQIRIQHKIDNNKYPKNLSK